MYQMVYQVVPMFSMKAGMWARTGGHILMLHSSLIIKMKVAITEQRLSMMVLTWALLINFDHGCVRAVFSQRISNTVVLVTFLTMLVYQGGALCALNLL